ncbi:erythromycin esterase family protein [Actinomadura sp. LD22]|uniref:Erythromycin esterase family protein n=1 Tax=Actinomadura physcomitrii TaxID=2650748 RepID=A0A6I4MTC9_9ACTN|nr:erythromycin esterase family protein [Actinomadura physcomitrii]MWA05939.1 erythromycin esterase family protein [Actinomadura physcomitrii]
MTQDICGFVPASCELLGLGEPTHLEPAFGRVRNGLFARLAEHGFRSIALETDRVAALAVDKFVRHGTGSLDAAMSEGFSHGFGDLDANRRLVAWMREYNRDRPAAERLAFHGFDAPMETMSVPSPRAYLEHVRDYLALDLDIAALTGEDRRWSRMEAVMDPAASVGETPEAERLRSVADDMLTTLYARAPELIAAASRAEWYRARTYLTAGLGLLRYHKQAAQRLDQTMRISVLGGTRDALMAQNLLDIRGAEARRGPTLVFSHNRHLQRNTCVIPMGGLETTWTGVGAVLGSLMDERYVFIAGSLGRSEIIGLPEPAPDTYEGSLQSRIGTWGLVKAASVAGAGARADAAHQQVYFPLDQETIDGADAVLHISDASAAAPNP